MCVYLYKVLKKFRLVLVCIFWVKFTEFILLTSLVYFVLQSTLNKHMDKSTAVDNLKMCMEIIKFYNYSKIIYKCVACKNKYKLKTSFFKSTPAIKNKELNSSLDSPHAYFA